MAKGTWKVTIEKFLNGASYRTIIQNHNTISSEANCATAEQPT